MLVGLWVKFAGADVTTSKWRGKVRRLTQVLIAIAKTNYNTNPTNSNPNRTNST